MQKSSSAVGVPTLWVGTKSPVLLKIPFEGSPIRTCVTSKLNAAKCVNCYWQICILLLLQTCTNKIFRSCAHCTGTNDKLFLLFHEIQCHYEKGNQIIVLESFSGHQFIFVHRWWNRNKSKWCLTSPPPPSPHISQEMGFCLPSSPQLLLHEVPSPASHLPCSLSQVTKPGG